MKLQIGDKVLVTAGKDKGKQGEVVRVLPNTDRVIIQGVNMYVRHMKKMQDRAGEKVTKERPLPTANIAVINDKGQPDRIGYKVAKNGDKVRIFKKTGSEMQVRQKKVVKK